MQQEFVKSRILQPGLVYESLFLTNSCWLQLPSGVREKHSFKKEKIKPLLFLRQGFLVGRKMKVGGEVFNTGLGS